MTAHPTSDEIDPLLGRLGAMPVRLDGLIRDHPDPAAWQRTVDDGWSAAQIVAHLRASDEILTPRIYQMLVRDDPPLPAFDERRWAEVAGYDALPVDVHFARMALRRYELLQLLRGLEPAAWARAGEHEEHGRVTIFALAAHIAGHEEEHLAQLEQVLGNG